MSRLVEHRQGRRFALETPEIPDEIRSIRLPGYRNIFELQGDDRYRMPDPERPSLWGTETLCGDWSGRLLIVLKDFASTDWHRNQNKFGVPYYSHTPSSPTNCNIVERLKENGVALSFEGEGNTTCGAVYASACFLLKDGTNLSTSIGKTALAASWPAIEFTIANMPNLTDIVLGGSEAFQAFVTNEGVTADRKEALLTGAPIAWKNSMRLHVTCHPGLRGMNSRVLGSGERGKKAVQRDWERILRHARLGKWA